MEYDFEEDRRRKNKLNSQLRSSPVVEISGVVSALGFSAGRSKGEDFSTFVFGMDVWRVGGSEIRTDGLTIRETVTEQDYEQRYSAYKESVTPDVVVRIRARLSENNVFESNQALLEEIVGPITSDQELNDELEALLTPETFDDPVFGEFVFDRIVDWFTAVFHWDGEEIELNLEPDDDGLDSPLKTARTLWRDREEWNKRIRNHMTRNLLKLKNENWLDEDETELSEDEFVRRLELEAITVHSDCTFEFWFDDDDLFGGHSINLSGTLSGGIEGADLEG